MYYRFNHYHEAERFMNENQDARLVAWFPIYIVFIAKKA